MSISYTQNFQGVPVLEIAYEGYLETQTRFSSRVCGRVFWPGQKIHWNELPGIPGTHQSHWITSLSWTGERKCNRRFVGEDKDGGRKYLNILPIKSNYDNKKEAQILKTPIPYPSLHPGLNFTSKFSTSSSQETQGYQEWGLWLDHMLYLLLLTPQGEGGRTPHTLLLLQGGASPMGNSPAWASPAWGLPTSGISYELPQHESLQNQAAPAGHPCWSPACQPAPLWILSSSGVARTCSRAGFPCG